MREKHGTPARSTRETKGSTSKSALIFRHSARLASDSSCASFRQHIRLPLGNQPHHPVPDVVSDSDAAPGTSHVDHLLHRASYLVVHLHHHSTRRPHRPWRPSSLDTLDLPTSRHSFHRLSLFHSHLPPAIGTQYTRASITCLGSQPCISRMILTPARHHHVPRNLLLRDLASSPGHSASSDPKASQITTHGLRAHLQ